jgi:DNA-binding XRE family transcriptional regulator
LWRRATTIEGLAVVVKSRYYFFMARPPNPPTTALAVAIRSRRGSVTGDEVAAILGVTRGTFYKIEGGIHAPSFETARRLARWLGEGWTVERVMDAAEGDPLPPTPT